MRCAFAAPVMDADGVVQATAKRTFIMLDSGPQGRFPARGWHTGGGAFDSLSTGLLLLALLPVGTAIAGESLFMPIDPVRPDISLIRPEAPFAPLPAPSPISAFYRVDDLPQDHVFSPSDFRPRGRSVFEDGASTGAYQDAPMLRGTTVWQRLAEYRTHGRVRLLTLWETGGTSVSLQADRKGEPSLQWTSHLMNRGAISRGLLDHLFAVSIAGASRGIHPTPRTTAPESMVKSTKVPNEPGTTQ